MSSSIGTGEGGLSSPSDTSEEAFLFLFFAPTRVIVLQGTGREKPNVDTVKSHRDNETFFLNTDFPAEHSLCFSLAFAFVPSSR